ncbi:hypothetical protein GE09DRAFT_116261 [Coniochaeta sp. 2T2.1]|nr:hypothetical protein GE09DRAFT_116261 [Coniochaeta sp. 2T2.1]
MLMYFALAVLPATALAEYVFRSNAVETITLPNTLYDGPVTAESIATKGHIDWPKLSPGVNDTTYDWWYYDVVSADASTSVTFVFYNAGPNGFINTLFGSNPLSASVSGILSNGTSWGIAAPATSAMFARPDKDRSIATTAVFENSGFSWNGTDIGHGKTKYVVTVDAPELGVTGTMTLVSFAPARYPCGLATAGQTEEAFPGVYWSVSVPDAEGSVDLRIDGTRVKFSGYGYHDKNWGDVPFIGTLSLSYWGHARLGPYSIVWANSIDAKGVEHASAYLAKDGKVLVSACGEGTAVVRPWGKSSEFPPRIDTGPAEGLEVLFDLGDGRVFRANVTTSTVVEDEGAYIRTLGTVAGGFGGKYEKTYHGAAMFEVFKTKL